MTLGTRTRQVLLLTLAAMVAVLVWVGQGTTGPGPAPGSGTASSTSSGTPVSSPGSATGTGTDRLPPEARQTIALIAAGGPFPYRQDGSTFGNRERLLPDRPSGYYREYTVPTPGSPDRGARRLVTGDGGEMYYTEDHYQSFSRID